MIKDYVTKISKDTIIVLTFNGINYLCSFILAVLVSRYLGIGRFGDYSFIFAFTLILGIISDFGLSTLLIRKINENKFHAKEIVFKFNIIKTFLSTVIFMVLFFSIYVFFYEFFYTAFIVGILIILPRSLMSTYESSLRGFLNQKISVVIKSINSILQLTVSYFLLISGTDLTEIFLTILVLDSLTAVLLYSANTAVIKRFNRDSRVLSDAGGQKFKEGFIPVLRESSVFFFNNFLMLSIKGMNVILLGYFSGTVSVGIYSAGSRFVNGIGLFSGALFNSFYPAISNIKNDLKMKADVTKKFITFAFILGSVITGLVFFLSEFLIELTFKTKESVIVLKILSFTMLPVLVYTITQSFLFSVYNEKFLMKILIIAWSLNIIISIILIIKFDYTGSAVALAFTEIFLMVAQVIKFRTDSKKCPDPKEEF